MKRLTGLILFLALAPAHAEIITMPGGPTLERETPPAPLQQPDEVDRSNLPHSGMLKQQVRQQYGEPSSTTAAVGDPPISRWIYDDFVVFFEYNHVISAVIPAKPRTIYNQDELRSTAPHG